MRISSSWRDREGGRHHIHDPSCTTLYSITTYHCGLLQRLAISTFVFCYPSILLTHHHHCARFSLRITPMQQIINVRALTTGLIF